MIGNIGSLLHGVSGGDFVQKALQMVGVPKNFAAGIGAIKDFTGGNFVGAMQNLKEAMTGREGFSLRDAVTGLGGKSAASAHSSARPSAAGGGSGIGGFAAALGLGGVAAAVGIGAAGTSVLGGLGKMMLGVAGAAGAVSLLSGGGLGLQAAMTKGRKAIGHSNIDSEIAKLPPNATFEQLIHAFMKGSVKDQEEEVKEMMDKMKKQDKPQGIGGMLRGLAGGVAKIGGGLLGGLLGAGFLPPIGMIAGGLLGSKAGGGAASLLSGDASKGKESRALMMEDLKFKMQQLTQMMQALSNVGNTMHQNAKNTIQNIRA